MKLNSGFYLFKDEVLKKKVDHIKELFSSEYNKFRLGYSIKANYNSALIDLLNKEQVSFDCASEKELDILLERNISAANVWVNSPYLEIPFVQKMFEQGFFIYADSFSQLECFEQCAKSLDKKIAIGVRLNLHEFCPSRFGIEATSFNIKRIRSFFQKSDNLTLTALHTHYSISDRSIQSLSGGEKQRVYLLSKLTTKIENSLIVFENISFGLSFTEQSKLAIFLQNLSKNNIVYLIHSKYL